MCNLISFYLFLKQLFGYSKADISKIIHWLVLKALSAPRIIKMYTGYKTL